VKGLLLGSLDDVPGPESGEELALTHSDVASVNALNKSSILLAVGEGNLVLVINVLALGVVAVEQALLLPLNVNEADVRDLLLVRKNGHVVDEVITHVHAYLGDAPVSHSS